MSVRPSVTQGPRHNFLRCLRARDFFQLTLFKVFTSSPTFFQAIFPRPGFSRERAGCPRCNPATFRDPASAGSVPGGAPAMAGFTAPRERANRCTGRPTQPETRTAYVVNCPMWCTQMFMCHAHYPWENCWPILLGPRSLQG